MSLYSVSCRPDSKDIGMGLDDLPLAEKGDVSVICVVAQLSHMGHELSLMVKAHPSF